MYIAGEVDVLTGEEIRSGIIVVEVFTGVEPLTSSSPA